MLGLAGRLDHDPAADRHGPGLQHVVLLQARRSTTRIDEIATLPIEDQPAAWGDLDEEVGTKYLPNIVTAYRNDLFGAGANIGGFTGDAAMSAINYKDLFVKQ